MSITNKRKHFIRVKESFICENCGVKVEGNGYTNHCPDCLYSKHVDSIIPGDRLNPCKGLMKPIYVEVKRGKYIIVHQCLKCGKIHRNKAVPNDNIDLIIELSAQPH